MKISILTLFPEMFDNFKTSSIIKRAIDKSLVDIEIINIRDFSKLNNKNLDDLLKQHDINLSIPQEYIMHLASSPDKPEDHISLGLSNAFLESVALKQIEQWFYTIKQLYKEEHDDQ